MSPVWERFCTGCAGGICLTGCADGAIGVLPCTGVPHTSQNTASGSRRALHRLHSRTGIGCDLGVGDGPGAGWGAGAGCGLGAGNSPGAGCGTVGCGLGAGDGSGAGWGAGADCGLGVGSGAGTGVTADPHS